MVLASQLRPGAVLKIGGELFKVIESTFHVGQGKMPGSVHSKLQHMAKGTFKELRFRPEDRLDWVAKRKLLESYIESEGLWWENETLRSLDLRGVDEVEERQAVQHGLDDVDVRSDTIDGGRACLERGDQSSLRTCEEGVDERGRGLARASRRVERGRHLRPEREVLAEAIPDAL